ncbi:MAG: polyhydroxybutyrate depolymerase [Baekduia sp.]|nr:polyhydroxybutyrate depolymerase [Baekduia sp.]
MSLARRRLALVTISCAVVLTAASVALGRQHTAVAPSGGATASAATVAAVPPTAKAAAAPPACASAPRGTGVTVDVATPDGPRSALLHLPPHWRDVRLPLVVALHGSGGDGPFMESYSGLSRLADKAGFAVVYPSAPGGVWAYGTDRDVGFIDELLDQLAGRACIDASRVYVTGVSNGGGMTARLGCRLAERVVAIAPVAGGYKALPACTPEQPVSVLEIHGTADRVVPYGGAPPDFRGSVTRYLRGWLGMDHCPGRVQRSTVNASTQRLLWTGCAAGTTVQHLRLFGAPHTWPGVDPRDPWPDAQEMVWDFFQSVGAHGAPRRG